MSTRGLALVGLSVSVVALAASVGLLPPALAGLEPTELQAAPSGGRVTGSARTASTPLPLGNWAPSDLARLFREDASRIWLQAKKPAGRGKAVKAKIRHPRKTNAGENRKAMPTQFVGVVFVPLNKRVVDDAIGYIYPKDGRLPANSNGTMLLKSGAEGSSQCRCFIRFNVNEVFSGRRPYTAVVRVISNDGTVVIDDTVDFEVISRSKAVTITYPTASGYPITGDEAQYFVPCGTTDAPITSALIAGTPGAYHTYTSTSPYTWWAEFIGLDVSPGPGNYELDVVNSDGDHIMNRPFNVSVN